MLKDINITAYEVFLYKYSKHELLNYSISKWREG